jgi:hypothetical protein
MKQILTILLITIISFAFSRNKLHFGAQVNVNFTTGILTDSEYQSAFYKELETLSFCYSAGGTIEYDLADKRTLQSGLLYRKMGDRSKLFTIEPFRPYKVKYSFEKVSLEIPVNIQFNISDRIRIFEGSSLVYNIYEKYYTFFFHQTNSTPKLFDNNDKFRLLGDLGLKYNLCTKLMASIYGQFDYLETYYDDLGYTNSPRNCLS